MNQRKRINVKTMSDLIDTEVARLVEELKRIEGFELFIDSQFTTSQ